MRWLDTQDADSYLDTIGMRIDSWNRLAYVDAGNETQPYWQNYQAPKDAQSLFSFALHVAGWLPKGP